MTDVGKTYEIR